MVTIEEINPGEFFKENGELFLKIEQNGFFDILSESPNAIMLSKSIPVKILPKVVVEII